MTLTEKIILCAVCVLRQHAHDYKEPFLWYSWEWGDRAFNDNAVIHNRILLMFNYRDVTSCYGTGLRKQNSQFFVVFFFFKS